MEADLTFRATHELALRQDAILHFRRIASRKDAFRHRAITNPQFSFSLTLTSPLQRSCFLLDQGDCDSGDFTAVRTWLYLDTFPASRSGTRLTRSGRVDRFKVTATLCARL
jgi:hypothetical protein